MEEDRPVTDGAGGQVIDITPRLEEQQRKRGGGGGGGSGGSRGGGRPRKLAEEEKDRFTDVGNADLLVAWHGNDIRYVEEWDQWIVWDGRKWVLDRKGARVRGLAIETTRRMTRDAKKRTQKLKKEIDTAISLDPTRGITTEETQALLEEEATIKWARASQSGNHVDRMVEFASSNDEVSISYTKLNQKPHLLNCKNGTLNLDTGELRKHNRSDYLTQWTPIAYKPDAECLTWWWFIDHAMGGNKPMMRYLQRVAGYSISGHVNEFAIFFHYGNGGRGKSTFLVTLRRALGDYATKAPRYLLFKTPGQKHETEITTLYGRRFSFCAEVEENQKLDEAFVKDSTSADPLVGRRMREDHWEFEPTHKSHIGCNYKPRIDGTDDGIWRRVHLIPWDHVLSKKHKRILEVLRGELEGILAWCVRGYIRWRKHGLNPPDEVLAATKQYREESDSVGEFLRKTCVFGPDKAVTNERLRARYEEHCQNNGIYAMSTARFNARLRAFDHGVSGLQLEDNVWINRSRRGWRGVGINPQP